MTDANNDIYSEDEDPAKPPSVTGEEDVFSGNSAGGEPADIDEELKKVGLKGDDNGMKELDVDEELEEEL